MDNPFAEFLPRARGFEIRNAVALAYASQVAYERNGDTEAWLRRLADATHGWGFDAVRCFDNASTGTQAVLLGCESFMVLAFRGTEMKLSDLKTDLRIRKIGGPLGSPVHRGFLMATLGVWDDFETP
ncbi:MAG: hypothetical protein R3324_10680, partial [Halobacteriales archaeon]|nr:hypothetical protein [Halobacteriales archaeon]